VYMDYDYCEDCKMLALKDSRESQDYCSNGDDYFYLPQCTLFEMSIFDVCDCQRHERVYDISHEVEI